MSKTVVGITIATLLIIGLSIIAIYNYSPNDIQSWLRTLLTAIITVLIGIAAGFAMYYHKVEINEAARKKQLRSLLRAELSDVIRVLDSRATFSITFSKITKTVLITYIQPLILEDAARSGLFESCETENMLHLARKIRLYNTLVSYFFSISSGGLSRPDFEQLACNAIDNIENIRKTIIKDSKDLLTQMDIKLSPSLEHNSD